MKRITFIVATLAVATVVASVEAHAQNGSLTRSFVSSAGNDANACTITQPCATFAHAYTKISANGIIAALDPGKYGPLTITTGVTVNGNGWAAITAPANGSGIVINAPSANVMLTGLEIDGAGAAYNGVQLTNANSLTITNCVVQNFVLDANRDPSTGNGIYLPAIYSGIKYALANVTVLNNQNVGIYYAPVNATEGSQTYITMDRITAAGNSYGVAIDTTAATFSITTASLSNSVLSNGYQGIYLGGQATTLTAESVVVTNSSYFAVHVNQGASLWMDNCNINNNDAGLNPEDTSKVVISRSTITGNAAYSYNNSTSPNGFYSYGNNSIDTYHGGTAPILLNLQ